MRNPAKVPFRIAAGIFLLFAIGHTLGFLTFSPPSAAGREVLDQMKHVPFDFGGTPATWWGLFKGFGLSISAVLVLFAILTWRLGGSSSDPSLSRAIAWLLCANQVVGIAVSLAFFGAIQAVFSAAPAICLAWAAFAIAMPNKASSAHALSR